MSKLDLLAFRKLLWGKDFLISEETQKEKKRNITKLFMIFNNLLYLDSQSHLPASHVIIFSQFKQKGQTVYIIYVLTNFTFYTVCTGI